MDFKIEIKILNWYNFM